MDLISKGIKNNDDAPIDLSRSAVRATLARNIKSDINAYCASAYDGGHRKHLGASQIGHVCKRYLFYIFRWAKSDTYADTSGANQKGRMMRLFNRGHREEERFVEWLRGIGAQVWEKDNDGNQFRVSGVSGHFGGSLYGVCTLPPNYGIMQPLLLEFKTQGTGPKFTKLLGGGVQKEKPKHFAQMSVYGYKYQLQYAIYQAINKNDDDLHVEIVELDWQLGSQLEQKAHDIIMSPASDPPPKFSLSAATLECRTCTFKGICHHDEVPEKSCRSCLHASPGSDGNWLCSKFSSIIPDEFIALGCDSWVPIK